MDKNPNKNNASLELCSIIASAIFDILVLYQQISAMFHPNELLWKDSSPNDQVSSQGYPQSVQHNHHCLHDISLRGYGNGFQLASAPQLTRL